MSLKAISFIGTGKYYNTKYLWEGKEFVTNLFPLALFKIFEPSSLYILVTEKAKSLVGPDGKNYCEVLKESLGNALNFVDIPEGKTQEELWEIFTRFTDIIEEGDELILDITHALRSIPIFVFTATLFLRHVKGTRIRHILYGAYEARDSTNTSPIFDLKPLLELMEWISGAEAFSLRGDVGALAIKLRDAIHAKDLTGDPARIMVNKMLCLSKAINFARSIDIMETSRELEEIIASVRTENFPKPFFSILKKIERDVSRLSFNHPDRLTAESLKKQLEIIEYCIEKGMLVQGIMMSREWVVNLYCMKMGRSSWLDKETRNDIEKNLNEELGRKTEVGKVWGCIRETRNDIAHCGMRESPIGINKLEKKANEILLLLKSLFEKEVSREDLR